MKIESDELLKVLEALKDSAQRCIEKAPKEEVLAREHHRGTTQAYEQAIAAVHATMLREKAPKGLQIYLNVRQKTRPVVGLPKTMQDVLQGKCSET